MYDVCRCSIGENLEVNNRLDEWKLALEGKGLIRSGCKSDYICRVRVWRKIPRS